MYTKVQDTIDLKERDVIRIVGFDLKLEKEATHARIEEVIAEMHTLPEIPEGLMTSEALSRYLSISSEELKEIPLKNSIIYNNILITRWTKNLFNGKFLN